MTTITALPDELVLSIFSHLDPLTIARVEVTSRQWRRVALDNARLWRDALWIDDGDNAGHPQRPPTGAAVLFRRIQELIARSGGSLDRLAVQLVTHTRARLQPIPEAASVKRILQRIPELRLRELWLDCQAAEPPLQDVWLENQTAWEQWTEEYESADPNLAPEDIPPAPPDLNDEADEISAAEQVVSELVQAAISNCTHLEVLHLNSSFQGSLSLSPLAQCSLKRLSIRCVYMSDRFVSSLLDVLPTVTHITLSSSGAECVPLSWFWRLLEQASETLESVDVAVTSFATDDEDDTASALVAQRLLKQRYSTIHLPRLYMLSIVEQVHVRGTTQAASMPSTSHPQLNCPALRHLTLHVAHPLPLLECFLGVESRLRSLFLEGLTNHNTHSIGALLYDRCATTLRRLTIEGRATNILHELVPQMTMVLDHITVFNTSLDVYPLRHLAALRLTHPTHRPIRDLYLIRRKAHDTTRDAAWLRSNIPNCVLSDSDPAQTTASIHKRVYRHRNTAPFMQRRPFFSSIVEDEIDDDM